MARPEVRPVRGTRSWKIAQIDLACALQAVAVVLDPASRDMPRERFILHGADRVSNEELLALLLGTGTRGRPALDVARYLLQRIGGVGELARATPRELVAEPGVGLVRAVRIAAAFQLGRRALEETSLAVTAVRSPEDVYTRLRGRMSGLAQEIFVVLALDVRNVVIDVVEVARGSRTGVDVHPREVFRPLIRQGAAFGVVAHNHPSGNPTPSPQDIGLTQQLREIGDLVGIPILDHIVFADGGYVSIGEKLG